jgi:hypothetical protein
MKWFAEYSPYYKRAWIVAEDGSAVTHPCIATLHDARAICRAHNAALAQAHDSHIAIAARHERERRMVMDYVSEGLGE